jgi:hypothetical protein
MTAAHYTHDRLPEKGRGLHYSRFLPISIALLLVAQLLARPKFQNTTANRPSQANGLFAEIMRAWLIASASMSPGMRKVARLLVMIGTMGTFSKSTNSPSDCSPPAAVPVRVPPYFLGGSYGSELLEEES